MDPTSDKGIRLCSTAHFFTLIGICFGNRFNMFMMGNDKNRVGLLFLFGLANILVYNYYTIHFYRRSFEKMYREVDDQSLENIIKSLEATNLKIR